MIDPKIDERAAMGAIFIVALGFPTTCILATKYETFGTILLYAFFGFLALIPLYYVGWLGYWLYLKARELLEDRQIRQRLWK